MILIVVSHPVNTEHDEADNVREKTRPQLDQFVSQVPLIHVRYGSDLDVEHHQRHRNSKDAVCQGFNSRLAESADQIRVAHNELRIRVRLDDRVHFSD